MSNFQITPQALLDLDFIWETIAREHPLNADGFIRQIMDTDAMLAESPRLGRARPELGSGIGTHPVTNRLIIYRPVSDEIHILRVYHGARRLTARSIRKR